MLHGIPEPGTLPMQHHRQPSQGRVRLLEAPHIPEDRHSEAAGPEGLGETREAIRIPRDQGQSKARGLDSTGHAFSPLPPPQVWSRVKR